MDTLSAAAFFYWSFGPLHDLTLRQNIFFTLVGLCASAATYMVNGQSPGPEQ